MDAQFAEVGEATCMVEQEAQREFGGARIAFEVGVRSEVPRRFAEVLLDRLVEVKYATPDELHDDRCEGWLGKRGGVITESGVRERFFSVSRKP